VMEFSIGRGFAEASRQQWSDWLDEFFESL